MDKGTSSGGITFLSLLTLLFIGLKLAKIITWSWWIVLLPLYGGVILFITLLIGVILFWLSKTKKKHKK